MVRPFNPALLGILEAYVFERGGVLYTGWNDENGDPRKKSTGLSDTKTNRKKAQRRADKLEQDAADVRSGVRRAVRPDVMFREGANMYLDSLPADYASKNSLEGRIRLRINPHGGNLMCRRWVPADVGRVVNATTLGTLTYEDIRVPGKEKLSAERRVEIQKSLLAKMKPNAQMSPQLREHLRVAIQAVFTHLIEREKIVEGKNPASEWGEVPVPKRKKRWLPWRFADRLVAAVPEQHRALFRFCLGTGLRKGEAFALCWTDLLIDGEALPEEWAEMLIADELEGAEEMPPGGFVHVSKSHDRKTPKGMKERVVPVPEWLADELRLARRFATSPFLFPDRDGKQRSRWVRLSDVTRAALIAAGLVSGFEAKCVTRGKKLRSCGFREKRPHDGGGRECPRCRQLTLDIQPVPLPLTFRHLRSSYAVAMLRSGGSIKGVADALGNTEAVAAGHYAGLLPQDLLRQANRVRLGPGSPMGERESKAAQYGTSGSKDVSDRN